MFTSFISIYFQGVLKVTRKCSNGHINYLFRRFHFIPFNCDNLRNLIKKDTINIYDAFDCLNKNYSILGNDKFLSCPDCKNYSEHQVSSTIYKTPNNDHF